MPNIAHKPTEKTKSEVAALVSFGIPQDEIAAYLGISKPTLAKHYEEELKLSSIKAHANVGRFLYNLASGIALKQGATYSDCSRAAMFWAKTRMGWRETTHIDHSNTDGTLNPLRIEIVAPDDNSTD